MWEVRLKPFVIYLYSENYRFLSDKTFSRFLADKMENYINKQNNIII
jgi:hypothetical protein